jgi:hypothetical protein
MDTESKCSSSFPFLAFGTPHAPGLFTASWVTRCSNLFGAFFFLIYVYYCSSEFLFSVRAPFGDLTQLHSCN